MVSSCAQTGKGFRNDLNLYLWARPHRPNRGRSCAQRPMTGLDSQMLFPIVLSLPVLQRKTKCVPFVHLTWKVGWVCLQGKSNGSSMCLHCTTSSMIHGQQTSEHPIHKQHPISPPEILVVFCAVSCHCIIPFPLWFMDI